MRIVTVQNIRQKKGATTGTSWDRVLEAKDRFPERFGACEFYVADSRHQRTSAVDRVASTFPKIRSGVCESADDRYVTNISELTPLPGPKLGETESLQIGTEIARGLPRRFPATDAFVKLCWSSAIAQPLEGEPTMGNPWTKGKCLGLQVTRTRLESWFTAFVDMGDVSPLSIEPPCVSETVAEVIETIGGKFWSETSFVPTNNELNGIKERERIARELSKKYRLLANRDDSPVAIAECLRNEQDIQADTVRSLTDPDLASSRVKNYKIEFSRTLRPLGYRYDPGESQPRYHVAKRSSPSGNTIAIVSDVGGHGPPWEPSFNMVVRGLGWRIAVPISRQYPVFSNEDWAKMNRNAAIVIRHLESTFVPEIDSLFGSAPAWFTEFPLRDHG